MIPNGRIVAVNFRPGSGGKFIQNCLALSRHCVLKHAPLAQWQIDQPHSDSVYQQKLSRILKTVPPPERIWDWLAYELRDDWFFGRIFLGTNCLDPVPDLFTAIAEKGHWVTYSAHSYGGAEHLALHWPEVRHVCLVNSDQFVADWATVKNRFTTPHTPGWETPPGLGFDFDIDSCIYNESAFLKQMRELYAWLGWDDFDSAPVPEYYRAYMAIHSK